jgi:calcium-dependent protein kinase
MWSHVSDGAKKLVSALLTFDPSKRISAMEALHSPWVQGATQNCEKPVELTHMYLQNLTKFQTVQKLEKAALTYITSQLITVQEISELRLVFTQLDKNGDGRLDRGELISAYEKSDLPLSGLEQIFQACDSDQNGFIDYTEFITSASNWQTLLSKERLESAFKVFDLDGNGVISKDELKAVLQTDDVLGDEVWEDLLAQADKNGDGVVTTI